MNPFQLERRVMIFDLLVVRKRKHVVLQLSGVKEPMGQELPRFVESIAKFSFCSCAVLLESRAAAAARLRPRATH